MRLFADYIVPFLILVLAYLGLQKISTQSRWSEDHRFTFQTAGVAFLALIIVYEYFAGRPLMDSVRESVGNGVCRVHMFDACPASIKYAVAREEVDRRIDAAKKLSDQRKLQEASEESRR